MKYLTNITFTPSVLFLIAANAVPIFGAIFWGWDVATILILYWIESVVIGVLNIPKMLASGVMKSGPLRGILGNLFLTVFFVFHYGMFAGVHGVFLVQIFEAKPVLEGLLDGGPIMWTVFILLLSHVFSMLYNFFGKKEYLQREASIQMFSVYGRVIIMHLVIIFGAYAVQAFGSPVYALVLLIGMKTLIDIAAHNKEHKRDPITV